MSRAPADRNDVEAARPPDSDLASALRESEERFRLAALSTSDIIYEWDVSTGTLAWFGPVHQLLGCDADRVPVTIDAFQRFIHPEDIERIRAATARGLSRGEPWKGEYRVVRGDGAVAHWHGSGMARFLETGRPRSVIGAISDVTERKRAEEALRASESKYRALFDQSTDGIYLHDRLGRILDANQMACQQTGYSREELCAMSVFELHPEGLLSPEEIARQWAAWKPGDRFTLEGQHRRKDGTAFPIEISTGTLLHDGLEQMLAVVRDISVRKQSERDRERLREQLAQAQKMESVGRLAGGVAHDFNNMLLSIIVNAELALERLEPASPIVSELQEIRAAAERSSDLTRQLLAFARKQPMSPRVTDLNQAVASSLKMLRRLLGEEIELVWNPGDVVWPVLIDPTQLDQILTNLCVNARDAIAGPGVITIETGSSHLDGSPGTRQPDLSPGDFTVLSVRDDGSGMDPETVAQLFEPFFTTKELGHGTGLGLSTVHGIVKQNGGHIAAESAPGAGSVFRVYLPRVVARAVECVARTGVLRSSPRGHETILLVEDEPAVLRVGQRMLEGLGYAVLTAGGSMEALRLAREHPGAIDLLVTDVVMPEMNGRALAQALAALHPSARCLYMSGYAADVIVHRGALEQGVCFIQKPFSFDSLAVKVREALAAAPLAAGAPPPSAPEPPRSRPR